MKFLYLTDSHIRASTPRSRADDYPEALYAKFEQIGNIIKAEGIDVLLFGGDLFDIADPATSIVNRYLQLFQSWGKPIYSIVGSHDIFGYNMDTIHRTALGTLIAAGVVKLIPDAGEITFLEDPLVRVVGTSHSYNLDENPETDYFKKRKVGVRTIQLCHGMIVPAKFFGKYTLVDDVKTEADLVLCGHYHPGFKSKVTAEQSIVNVGSLGRPERTHRELSPSVVIIDTLAHDFNSYAVHPLDNIKNDIWTVKDIQVQQTISDNIQAYVEELQKRVTNFESVDLKSFISTMGQQQGYSVEVITKTLSYIETKETQ